MSDEIISQAIAPPGAAAVPGRREGSRNGTHAGLSAELVDESLPEADTIIDSPVPDWCNLGLTLRIVVAINVLYVCIAAAQAASIGAWLDQWLQLAMVLEPVLIASLLLGCLVRRTSWHLPASVQVTVALLLPALLTIAAALALRLNERASTGTVLRDALFALMLTAAVMYWARLRDRAYSPALAEAQLQALQSRIRPHFLFNSLNAALGLIRSDPRRAETVLEDISDLFRVLMRDSRERVPLGDEVALCKQYLAIEKLRLGDRLQTSWNVDTGSMHALLPALLLQPLVENAVHHGIEPSITGGSITVDIVRTGRNIDITIANPWQGDDAATRTRGNRIGLDNVKQRLALVHDIEASIESTVRDGRFVVHVRLPAERRRAPRAGKPA